MFQKIAHYMLISIVTVHLDDPEGLFRTWRSLEALLPGLDCEWIVIDGGSKTKGETMSKALDAIQRTAVRYISEPDEGLYDAMNKGTAMASGDWLLYLNSGDELTPELTIDRLSILLENCADMIWANCQEIYENGEVVTLKPRPPFMAWYGMPVNHQNILFRREILGSRPYRLDFPIAADYELLSRLVRAKAVVSRPKTSIARFYRGGLSTVDITAALREEQRVRALHFPHARGLGWLILTFKLVNARIARYAGLRRLWRRHF